MLVVLLSSFANAQITNPPNILYQGSESYRINFVNYQVPQLEFRQELASFANGTFDWSWVQSRSDTSANQVFFDPFNEIEHRSNYRVNITRNGQSQDVTVTVSSTMSDGLYRWGPDTGPTSTVDYSDIDDAIEAARASL